MKSICFVLAIAAMSLQATCVAGDPIESASHGAMRALLEYGEKLLRGAASTPSSNSSSKIVTECLIPEEELPVNPIALVKLALLGPCNTPETIGRWAKVGEIAAACATDVSDKHYIYDAIAQTLAMHPDQRVRDGVAALRYSSLNCAETNWQDPDFLQTYAAAHAELGNFPDAIRYQEMVLESRKTREAATDPQYQEAKKRLDLYKHESPFRYPPKDSVYCEKAWRKL